MRKLILTPCALVCLFFFTHAQIAVPTWTDIGPIRFPVNGSGQINGIGRVTKLKFDPVQPGKIYACSASGGLWKSFDAGSHWLGTGTDKMPYHKEATLCIDYRDTSILYLGTGDPNYYYDGLGVWKSTNAGATWAQSNTGMGNVLVVELFMDPAHHDTMIAATNHGIYKSYNAGANWVRKFTGGQFTDMKYKPGAGGRVIYACTMDSFYRSDDAGETWQLITNGYYIPAGGGGQGIRIAVSPADSNIVYLGMVANRGSVFKSNDGGHSFNVVKDSFALSLSGYSASSGGQGNYNFDLNVDPIDTNTLYFVSQNVWKSTQGGLPSSWQQITNWWAVVHTDMHHITFDPNQANRLYNANDGGVWLTTDSGADWSIVSDGLDGTEIAPAASSKLDKNIISIGTQDNGELYHDADWVTNRGGDWYEQMAFDYFNPATVYYANGNRRVVTAGDQNMHLPFINDYGSIVFSRSNPNVAFVGKDTIVRTQDLNSAIPNWTLLAVFSGSVQAMALSPDDSNKLFVITNDDSLHICSNAMSAAPVFSSYATPFVTYNAAGITLIEHQPNAAYMYNQGLIYYSNDTGRSWTDISYNYPPSQTISAMVHDRFTGDQSIFIANSGSVYYKRDTMTHWQNISGNLPTVAQIQGIDMFNDGSPASCLRVQYYGRGMWQAPLTTVNRSVAASFGLQYICGGTSVQFSDSSFNMPTWWNWSFPGGTPSSSSSQNPLVSYPAAGSYTATLTAGNGFGSDTKVEIVNIITYAPDSMPVVQGFEDTLFPPQNWVNYDGGGDSVVWQRCNYGAYGLSQHSMFFNNFSFNETGLTKGMRFGTDLSQYDSLFLTFDVAYQVLQGYRDSLEVAVSTDCGHSFERVYCRGGFDLATAPFLDSPQAPFYPVDTQWRTDSVNLSAYSSQNDVVVSFNNISGYGTDLYVDNINLHGRKHLTNGLQDVNGPAEQISVYPNPSRGEIIVSWSGGNGQLINLSLYDALGKRVKEITLPASTVGGSRQIDLSSLPEGVYCLRSETGISKNFKILLQK